MPYLSSPDCAYSIVEFSQPEDAQKAITTLSDTDLKGRPVFIREVSIRKDIAQHDISLISIFLNTSRIAKMKQDMVHLQVVETFAVVLEGVVEALVAAEDLEEVMVVMALPLHQLLLQVLNCTLAM